MMSRRIVCVANKYTIKFPEVDGNANEETLIIVGVRHYDMVMREHIKDISEFYWSRRTDEVQGFLDNKGVFLDRNEAWGVAFRAGQIIKRVGSDHLDGGTLFIENLY